MILKLNKGQIAAILAATCYLGTTDASHVVSGTNARLPMSLSTVIQDLEAEGASYVTTAAFLTSKSVRNASCSNLLRSLFGVSGDGDHDEEVEYGTTTAFGKKLANDGDDSDNMEDGGSGVAIACPSSTATVSEVSSTVVACGGTVVYVADPVDLGRGEGLFDSLGPAIERLLAARVMAEKSSANGDGGIIMTSLKDRPSTLIVVFSGAESAQDIAKAKSLFEASAAKMLHSIIQSNTPRATKLSDVFDRIEYLSSSEKDVDMHLCPAGGKVGRKSSPAAREPAEVAGSVKEVVEAGLVENLGPMVEMAAKVPVKQACPRLTNAVDLAAARVLGPLAKNALEGCLDLVGKSTGTDGTRLVPEFGALCDAAVKRALEDFDNTAGARFKKSPVAKRIRADLMENLYSELCDIYDVQVASLKSAAFEAFRGRLNKLRITPALANDMKEAATTSLEEFASAAKKLRAPHAPASWTSIADQITDVRTRFNEHNSERLRAARASGQFKPVPRKGVTVGFHWLLPKPFGNDYRQEPWLTHTADDLVYAPVDGVTDVSPTEIRTGDWRKSVVPAPSSTEMMYLK